jgi:hypothetical protein
MTQNAKKNPFYIEREAAGADEEQYVENNRGVLVGVRQDARGVLCINGRPLLTRDCYVARSGAIGGEWGLFANRWLKRDEPFLQYCGRLVSARRPYQSGYVVQFASAGRYIGVDAYPYVGAHDALERLGAFANHADAGANVAPFEQEMQHCDQHMGDGQEHRWVGIMMRALRDIAPGEELLWDYGQQYWSRCADRVVSPPLQQPRQQPPYGKKHHHDVDEDDDDDDDRKKSKLQKLKPHLNRKNAHRVKKAAKVVVPLVLL